MADQDGQRLELMTLFPRHVPSSATSKEKISDLLHTLTV